MYKKSEYDEYNEDKPWEPFLYRAAIVESDCTLRCKCGSVRLEAKVSRNGRFLSRILVSCKKCGETLWYRE